MLTIGIFILWYLQAPWWVYVLFIIEILDEVEI